MKLLPILLVLTLCGGCTSLRQTELAPDELQTQIRSGEIIAVGDKVEIITADEVRHEFKVTAIEESFIKGESETVAIDDIVALKSREFSGGKTALLAGGTLLAYQIMAAIAIAATVGL